MATRRLVLNEDDDNSVREKELQAGSVGYAARLITQGRHRFFSLTMPSDVLGDTCVVDTRREDPIEGFQRVLDEKRAKEIAEYIDHGFGTIPCAIVLSAQPEANLHYNSRTQVLRFKKSKRAFLILDGQHRVFGFRLAKSKLRVPVVIYNGLSKADEVRLFIDINTKQRPVPNELLLDIKRLADTETNTESLLREVFDLFNERTESPLFGLMSPSQRVGKKISRVTFNSGLRPVWKALEGADAEYVYQTLAAYLHAWLAGLRNIEEEDKITNSTCFRAIMLLFPFVAEKVFDRFEGRFSVGNFSDVLEPLSVRLRKSDFKNSSGSINALHDLFKRYLQSGFSISRGRAE